MALTSKKKFSKYTLVEPTCATVKGLSVSDEKCEDVELEYSIHEASKAFRRDCEGVFAGVNLRQEALLVIPIFQHARADLVERTSHAEAEKDRLLHSFFRFSRAVCSRLTENNEYWADFIDPCTGSPVLGQAGNSIYAEVDAIRSLLHYSTSQSGCCGIILHPLWRSHCYPASLLTNAPLTRVQATLESVCRIDFSQSQRIIGKGDTSQEHKNHANCGCHTLDQTCNFSPERDTKDQDHGVQTQDKPSNSSSNTIIFTSPIQKTSTGS